jgi:2-keto-3-deoxy-L-rhamnonate aldolase RhmA
VADTRLGQILTAGGYAAGTMVFEFNTPGMPRLLDALDLDFVVFDMEHSGFEIGDIRALLAWSRAATFTPIVRVPSHEYHFLARVHDVGARGVMLPMVGTPTQAAAAVRACKYPPHGMRGAAFAVAHDDFRSGEVAATMAAADRENLLIAQIETAQGVEQAEEIAAVPGIDILWIGHFDLSLSLGIPGQFDHPRFVEAVDTVVAAAARHNRPLGILVSDPAAGRFWIERGFRIICYSADIWLLQRALAAGVAWIRALKG